MTSNKLEEISDKLTAWFLPEQHKERKLPGGGRWFYVPHQDITKRLNDVCLGDWSTKVTSTNIAGDYTVVILELTICGVTRAGIGDDKTVPDVNDEGKAKIIGTPPVRAFRHAFKDACEQFGICAYLDEQSSNKAAFIKFMQSKGDMRAYKYAQENDWKEGGAMGKSKSSDLKPKESGFLGAVAGIPATITEGQQKRLWAIAKSELQLNDEQIKSVLKKNGFEHTKDIPISKYEQVVEALKSFKEESPKLSRLQRTGLSLQSTEDLYPANNLIVKQVRTVTGHDPNWVFAQCRHYECDRPGMMPPEKLQKLVGDMLVDFAVVSGVVGDRAQAVTSVESALNFAAASGQPLLDAALAWLARYQPTSVR